MLPPACVSAFAPRPATSPPTNSAISEVTSSQMLVKMPEERRLLGIGRVDHHVEAEREPERVEQDGDSECRHDSADHGAPAHLQRRAAEDRYAFLCSLVIAMVLPRWLREWQSP